MKRAKVIGVTDITNLEVIGGSNQVHHFPRNTSRLHNDQYPLKGPFKSLLPTLYAVKIWQDHVFLLQPIVFMFTDIPWKWKMIKNWRRLGDTEKIAQWPSHNVGSTDNGFLYWIPLLNKFFWVAGIPEWFSMKYFCDGNFGSFGNASVQVRNPEKPSELFLGHLVTPVI